MGNDQFKQSFYCSCTSKQKEENDIDYSNENKTPTIQKANRKASQASVEINKQELFAKIKQ